MPGRKPGKKKSRVEKIADNDNGTVDLRLVHDHEDNNKLPADRSYLSSIDTSALNRMSKDDKLVRPLNNKEELSVAISQKNDEISILRREVAQLHASLAQTRQENSVLREQLLAEETEKILMNVGMVPGMKLVFKDGQKWFPKGGAPEDLPGFASA